MNLGPQVESTKQSYRRTPHAWRKLYMIHEPSGHNVGMSYARNSLHSTSVNPNRSHSFLKTPLCSYTRYLTEWGHLRCWSLCKSHRFLTSSLIMVSAGYFIVKQNNIPVLVAH